MPMCQVQLKSTDLRSLASGAGVYCGGPGGGGNCAAAESGRPTAKTTPSRMPDALIPVRRTMLFPSRLVLVCAAAARDLDLALVGERDRTDEAERLAVSRREVADRDRIAGLHSVRAAGAEAKVGKRVRGARRHHPIGDRAVGSLDVEIHRAVRIGEGDLRQSARYRA